MELGPGILALVTHLQGMDPIALKAFIRNPGGAPAEILAGIAPLPAADLPPRVPIDVPAPPRTILEKIRTAATDPLLPHYGVYLSPFELVFPGSEEERFADLLSLSEAERPMFVVGVMRDNIPELALFGELPSTWTHPMLGPQCTGYKPVFVVMLYWATCSLPRVLSVAGW
jgi:hypothetical protein